MFRKTIPAIPALSLLVVCLFIYVPHLIYFENVEYFKFNFLDMLPILFLVAVTVFAGLVLISTVIPKNVFHVLSATLAFLALFTWLQGDLFVISYGVLDDSEIPFSNFDFRGMIELGILLLVFVFALLAPKKITNNLNFILVLICIGQLAIVSYKAISETNEKSEITPFDDEFFNYSSQKNIIVIILDTFGSEYFSRILQQSPGLTNQYPGFVNFTDAISNYPATRASIPSLLSGRMALEGEKYPKYFTESSQNGFLQAYADQGYLVSVVGSANRFKSIYPERFVSEPPLQPQKIKTNDIRFLIDLSLFRSAPHILKEKIHNKGNWLASKTTSKIPNQNPEKAKYMLELIAKSIKISDTRPRFKFIHVRLPHPKFNLDANCNSLTENYSVDEAMLMQSQCTLKLLNQYLNQLKNLGLYDSSLIMVLSDHGARIYDDFTNTGFPSYFDLKSAGALFMLKGINQTKPFEHNHNPVSLLNIHELVMDEEMHQSDFSQLIDTNRLFYSYKNGFNVLKGYMQGGALYRVKSNYSNPNSWELIEFQSQSCSPKNLPFTVEFKDRNRTNDCAKFGFHHQIAGGIWSEGYDSRVLVKLNPNDLRQRETVQLSIQFELHPSLSTDNQILNLYINDQLMVTENIDNHGINSFEVNIPIDLLLELDETEIRLLLPAVEHLKAPDKRISTLLIHDFSFK